jgi:predicted lactoylglutathione lyase
MKPRIHVIDQVVAHAKAAGAVMTDPPHDRPWGIYSGYFRDPDGHLWEIIWNPALDLVTSGAGDRKPSRQEC